MNEPAKSPAGASRPSPLLIVVGETAAVLLLAVLMMFTLRGRSAEELVKERFAAGGSLPGNPSDIFGDEPNELMPVEPRWASLDEMLKGAPDTPLVEKKLTMEEIDYTIMLPEGAEIEAPEFGDGIVVKYSPTAHLKISAGTNDMEWMREASGSMSSLRPFPYMDEDTLLVEHDHDGPLVYEFHANTTAGYRDLEGGCDNPKASYPEKNTLEECWLMIKCLRTLKMVQEVPTDPVKLVELVGAKMETNEQGDVIGLDFGYKTVGPTILAVLENFPKLQSLEFQATYATDKSFAVLAKLPDLTSLGFRDTSLSGAKLVHVFSCKNLQDLQASVGIVESDVLSKIGDLTKLKFLTLASVDEKAQPALKELAKLTELEELHLEHGDKYGADTLSFLPQLDKLKLLSLGGEVTDAVMTSIGQATPVETLYLGRASISGAGLKPLAGLTNLKSLSIEGITYGDNQMTVTGADLAALSGLENLEFLKIENAPIDDAAVDHLVKLPKLEKVYVVKGKLTDAALTKLIDMKQLKELILRGNEGVTDEGVAAFKEARPEFGYISK